MESSSTLTPMTLATKAHAEFKYDASLPLWKRSPTKYCAQSGRVPVASGASVVVSVGVGAVQCTGGRAVAWSSIGVLEIGMV